jgi:hypothetical protein
MLADELKRPLEELLRLVIHLLLQTMMMKIMMTTFTLTKTWMVNVESLGNSENHP